jgi:hypothetical protein
VFFRHGALLHRGFFVALMSLRAPLVEYREAISSEQKGTAFAMTGKT